MIKSEKRSSCLKTEVCIVKGSSLSGTKNNKDLKIWSLSAFKKNQKLASKYKHEKMMSMLKKSLRTFYFYFCYLRIIDRILLSFKYVHFIETLLKKQPERPTIISSYFSKL